MTPPYRSDDPLVTRLCQELKLAMRKIGVITTAHYENDPRAHIAAALNVAWRKSEASALRRAAEWQPTHRHYKGGLYRLIAFARHSEAAEEFAIYESQDRQVWARPKAMFEDGRFTTLIHSSPSAESDNGK